MDSDRLRVTMREMLMLDLAPLMATKRSLCPGKKVKRIEELGMDHVIRIHSASSRIGICGDSEPVLPSA
jgi:hypothetical protein